MNLLSFVSENIHAKPADLLLPIKQKIEKQLGKKIETFSIEIDSEKSELTICADGKFQREKDKMLCYAMKAAVKLKLGKKAPDFTKVAIHYDNGNVGLAMYNNGEIQTHKL